MVVQNDLTLFLHAAGYRILYGARLEKEYEDGTMERFVEISGWKTLESVQREAEKELRRCPEGTKIRVFRYKVSAEELCEGEWVKH